MDRSDMPTPPGNPAGDQLAISDLMAGLRSDKGSVRQQARERLVEIGAPAAPYLIEALGDRSDQVRWEAAKALTEIPDPRAAEALVGRLKDDFSIRWLASEALIKIGEPAFVPLLHGLLADPDAPRLREAARHVLGGLKKAHPTNAHISEMLNALSGQAQTETVPWVARSILVKLGLVPRI